MATWMDGPEYAPLERPDEFVDVPHQNVLTAPPPQPTPPPAPPEQPAFSPPPTSTDLAAIVPPQPDARDPHAPFEMTVASVTSWSGKEGDEAPWTPDQPLAAGTTPALSDFAPPVGTPVLPAAQAAFPAPGTLAWFAPSQDQPQPPANGPVSLRDLVNAVTVPALISLLLGIFVHPLSLLLLVVGLVAASRIAYRHRHISIVIGATAAVLVLVVVVLIANDADMYSFFEDLSTAAQYLSAAVAIALVAICQRALAHHEKRRPR